MHLDGRMLRGLGAAFVTVFMISGVAFAAGGLAGPADDGQAAPAVVETAEPTGTAGPAETAEPTAEATAEATAEPTSEASDDANTTAEPTADTDDDDDDRSSSASPDATRTPRATDDHSPSPSASPDDHGGARDDGDDDHSGPGRGDDDDDDDHSGPGGGDDDTDGDHGGHGTDDGADDHGGDSGHDGGGDDDRSTMAGSHHRSWAGPSHGIMGRGRSGVSVDDRAPATGDPAIPDAAGPPPPTADALDRAAVEAVLAGDREAFRRLVERESATIIRVCRRILGDGAEAEDVAQEAFVTAYRSLASWRGDGPFGAWLSRIAVRLAVRQAGRRGTVVWRDPGTVATPDDRVGGEVARAADRAALAAVDHTDPARMMLRAERAAELRTAVARLPEPYREVVALRFFADATLDDIARQTGRPLGTVKTHLHRGLARLRDAVGGGDVR